MAPLQTQPALEALANVDVKSTHEPPLDGQLFLILGGDPSRAHRTVTVRTRGWERRGVDFVDVRGAAPVPTATRRRAALRPGRQGRATRVPREKGAACR